MVTKRLPAAKRKQQIAEKALCILARDGPRALTLQTLAKSVGVTDASLLRHFKDKQAIVHAAIELFGSLLAEDLPRDISDPIRRLGAFFVRRLMTVRARPELMLLAYSTSLRDAAGEDAALVDEYIQESARFIAGCVKEAQQKGEIATDIPAQMWVWMIAGVMRGAVQSTPGLVLADAMSPERAWELLEAILRRGVGKQKAPK